MSEEKLKEKIQELVQATLIMGCRRGDGRLNFDRAKARIKSSVNGLTNRFFKLLSARASAWIPVSEKLPEESGEYIATYLTEYGLSSGVERFFEGEGWEYDENRLGSKSKIIAWQPLPEPYQEITTAN